MQRGSEPSGDRAAKRWGDLGDRLHIWNRKEVVWRAMDLVLSRGVRAPLLLRT